VDTMRLIIKQIIKFTLMPYSVTTW